MRPFTLAITTLAYLAASSSVFAQVADDPHHPAPGGQPPVAAPATPPPAQAPDPSAATPASPGMMGPGMRMMGGSSPAVQMGTMPMTGMMMDLRPSGDRVEGRLAFIKAELKITDAQTPQWNAFADSVRSNGKAMAEMQQTMMSAHEPAKALPERLAFEETAASSHLTAIKTIKAALDTLYGVLSADQKKAADSIVIGPMGMPMGMM